MKVVVHCFVKLIDEEVNTLGICKALPIPARIKLLNG